MNIYLGDHFEAFIKKQIASGRFANASEVVRDAMRLMEEREDRLDVIRRGIDEGLADVAAGRFTVVDDLDAFFDDLEREIDVRYSGDSQDDSSLSPRIQRHVAEETPEYR